MPVSVMALCYRNHVSNRPRARPLRVRQAVAADGAVSEAARNICKVTQRAWMGRASQGPPSAPSRCSFLPFSPVREKSAPVSPSGGDCRGGVGYSGYSVMALFFGGVGAVL
jgi:hypothetical protein